MNKDIFQGKLKEISGEIKKKWGKLTDDDITRTEGNVEALSGVVQQRMGLSKEEASRQTNEFMTSMSSRYETTKDSLGDKLNDGIDKVKNKIKH